MGQQHQQHQQQQQGENAAGLNEQNNNNAGGGNGLGTQLPKFLTIEQMEARALAFDQAAADPQALAQMSRQEQIYAINAAQEIIQLYREDDPGVAKARAVIAQADALGLTKEQPPLDFSNQQLLILTSTQDLNALGQPQVHEGQQLQEVANIRKFVLDQKEILRDKLGVKVEEVEKENKNKNFPKDDIYNESISIDSINIEFEKERSEWELRNVEEHGFIKKSDFNESQFRLLQFVAVADMAVQWTYEAMRMNKAIQFFEIAMNYGNALNQGVVDMWNNFHSYINNSTSPST